MILTVEGLSFSYPGHEVIKETTFSVDKGEVVAILGTNGTGKTTLLRCMNRILKPKTGSIFIEGESISGISRKYLAQRIGYIEQHRHDFRATVFNTVLMGRKPYIKWDITPKDIEIASQAMEMLGLSDFALRHLDELSGGELQKVIIARALAQQPDVLLMDEPTTSLDLKNQIEVMQITKQISRSRGIAVVASMHELNLALKFADQFILLKDGVIYAAGGSEVMTVENIEAVYDQPVLIKEFNGRLIVIPLANDELVMVDLIPDRETKLPINY